MRRATEKVTLWLALHQGSKGFRISGETAIDQHLLLVRTDRARAKMALSMGRQRWRRSHVGSSTTLPGHRMHLLSINPLSPLVHPFSCSFVVPATARRRPGGTHEPSTADRPCRDRMRRPCRLILGCDSSGSSGPRPGGAGWGPGTAGRTLANDAASAACLGAGLSCTAGQACCSGSVMSARAPAARQSRCAGSGLAVPVRH